MTQDDHAREEGSPRKTAVRLSIFLAAGLVAAVAITAATDTLEPRVSAVVTALATIALAAVAAEALFANRALVIANRELVRAAQDEAAASRQEAIETSRAVDATVGVTLESRRQALLASLPFLRMTRARPANGEEGLDIVVPVENLGPGHALEAVLFMDVQYRSDQEFRQTTVVSGWPRAVLAAGEQTELRINARDLRNTDAPAWDQYVKTDDGQKEVPPPPNLFIPDVIRIRLRWLSTLGARAEQAYLWETGDFSKVIDQAGAKAWTWRFDFLALDPGADGLEGVRFTRPDA